MNIEEAIKMLKTAVENDKKNRIITIYDKKPLLRDAIEVVLKALEGKRDNMMVVYRGGRRSGTEAMVVKDYISKDKIREKIKEITNYNYTSVEERDCQVYARQVLKELLEENCR